MLQTTFTPSRNATGPERARKGKVSPISPANANRIDLAP